jgi:tRNA dimethylallyltransferase
LKPELLAYPSGVSTENRETGRQPLLLIVGPTASGKSRLGVEVAERLGGEIISADAFAVYRGLDIGTDKPGAEALSRVHHHLIDVADPRNRFSAGAFAAAARQTIAQIRGRGVTPVVVGGTHFWVHALLRGLFPSPPHNPELIQRLAADWERSPDGLYRRLMDVDPAAASKIGAGDRQRVIRALEVYEATGQPISEHWKQHTIGGPYLPLMVAPKRPRQELYAKIDARVDVMFASGLREEVRRILASGVPRDAHALKAIGYRQVVEFLDGRRSLESAVAETKTASRRLAKRQLTWLRGMTESSPHWVPPVESGGSEAVIRLWSDELVRRGLK